MFRSLTFKNSLTLYCSHIRIISNTFNGLMPLHFSASYSLALTALAEPGGWVDTAMLIGRTGMFNIIRKQWKQWNFKNNGVLKNDLRNRGVDHSGVLPNYHYRDDALDLWNAIEKYVAEVVNKVYCKSSTVQ